MTLQHKCGSEPNNAVIAMIFTMMDYTAQTRFCCLLIHTMNERKPITIKVGKVHPNSTKTQWHGKIIENEKNEMKMILLF